LRFEAVAFDDVDWSDLDGFEDRTFCQRQAWLEFIGSTQGGEVVVGRLDDGGAPVGWFTGVITKRFGARIMGSPFPGWTTPYLGFNLIDGVPRSEAVAALLPFVFDRLGCLHLELADPRLTRDDLRGLPFETQVGTTFVSDLRVDEDAIFAAMDSSTRRAIRKAAKSGVVVEEADGPGFADEYYGQLIDVFAKQGLKPTYGRERVTRLIDHVHPTGDLLLLRARDADGRSVATGIFPGFNQLSYFWGNGSLREFQILRPNEAIHWSALRYWRKRGILDHNWGGGGDYKEKYGGQRVETLHFRMSRYAAIGAARELARKAYYLPRNLKRRQHLRRIGRAE
jgi:hypothetical protein